MNKKCPSCNVIFFVEERDDECTKSVPEFMASRFQLCSKCSEKFHLTIYINGTYSLEPLKHKLKPNYETIRKMLKKGEILL